MTMKTLRRLLSAIGLSSLASVATAATLTITYVQDQGVPLSPWMTGLMALTLAILTYAFFRARGSARLFVIGTGVAIAVSGVVVFDDAQASFGTPQALVVSPTVIIYDVCSGGTINDVDDDFYSGVGRITLTGVSDVGGTLQTGPGQTTCAIGTVLTGGPSSTCHITTNLFNGC